MSPARWKTVLVVGALAASAWCVPAGAAAHATPTVSAISVGGALPAAPEVTVTGAGFGPAAPGPVRSGNACDPAAPGSYYGAALNLQDLTGGWSAGKYVTESLG